MYTLKVSKIAFGLIALFLSEVTIIFLPQIGDKLSVVQNRLERKTVKRKKVFATLKVLGTVVEELTKEISPEDADRLISEEVFSPFYLIFIIT